MSEEELRALADALAWDAWMYVDTPGWTWEHPAAVDTRLELGAIRELVA